MTPSDICQNLIRIKKELKPDTTLVAVSKTFPPDAVKAAYDCGHRDFGENYVQEWKEKQAVLPADIRWHFIGHLQTNKVKYLIPGIYMIHSVDSEKLLMEIIKRCEKQNYTVHILLQIHIADEKTKFGMSRDELWEICHKPHLLSHPLVKVRGLMGMATFTDDANQICKEFSGLRELFEEFQKKVLTLCPEFNVLSMGMSSDFRLALEQGSNMVRIGSAIFGSRSYAG
ncbi:MAG: YggS family pyridoxal phosphate-dependent enzyme [Bacteroidia bacterium]|nr:YggS family pyridoxal phosphate-dependent enzyme [Bacteroidia bacterium]